MAIRKSEDEIRSNPWLKSAASGSLLAAHFSRTLKVVVEHSSMTNQTHLFRQLDGRGSDQCATPGTDDVIHRRLFMILKMDTLTQFDLP